MPAAPARERSAPNYLTYNPSEIKKKRKPRKSTTYEVDKVLKSRNRKGQQFYRIRWKGYGEKDDTWEPAKNCNCTRLIKAFEKVSSKKTEKKKPVTKKKPRKETKAKARASVKAKKTGSKKKPAAKKTTTKKAPAKKATAKKATLKRSKSWMPNAVDPVATVEQGVELVSGWTTMLKYIDLSQNSDKYYVIQILSKGSSTWLYQRWGRSGTDGQQVLTEMAQAEAEKGFADKYQEKTGNAWGSSAANVDGKYWPIKVGASPDGEGKWEYYQDNHMDGKTPGWYPYHASAIPTVEEVYVEWRNNPGAGLDVRCVQSGHFSYRVNFDQMEQTNLSTQKKRPIRRK